MGITGGGMMDKDTVFGTDDGTMTGKPVLNDKQSHIYWQNKCQEQGKEIETLRSELKDAVQALNDEERRGDEWERRAMIYIEAMEHSDPKLWVSDWHPEAAEWFE